MKCLICNKEIYRHIDKGYFFDEGYFCKEY
jgi:hypothetical protein